MTMKGFIAGSRSAIPTVIGYLSIGLACGIVGAKAGITPVEMFLMSVLVYAGSGQFAISATILTHEPVVSIVMTVFLINLRHFLMSLHVSTVFPQANLGEQVLIGSFLTDESYGVLLGEHVHNKEIKPSWMYGNNFTSYSAWIAGTTLGALLGSLIPNPDRFGIDFALIAMFLAIFMTQLEGLRRTVRWR